MRHQSLACEPPRGLPREGDGNTSCVERIEQGLRTVLATATRGGPPHLRQALFHAVFPAGNRIRPRLCLAVAHAHGDPHPQVSGAAATAVELLHCASLVHDDLPCFDDAPMRRGRPTVHRAFGEATAVLAGDGLLVLSLQALAGAAAATPGCLLQMVSVLAAAAGCPRGLIAGQAWEGEQQIDLAGYHAAKTGALFEAAVLLGALAAAAGPAPWWEVGHKLGQAYQLADDLADALAEADRLGKPSGRDAALDRPSAVRAYGVRGARQRAAASLREAEAAIPIDACAEPVRACIRQLACRFVELGILAPDETP
jgi:geranylgeranyl diphosphate synthase type II